MLAPKIVVSLEPDESAALDALCRQDRRPPKHYLRWLVVQEARKRGILGDPPPDPPPTAKKKNGAPVSQTGAALPATSL